MTESEILAHAAEYLVAFGPRLSLRARQDIRYRLTHWCRTVEHREWTLAAVENYRTAAMAKGYSPATIESVVAAIRVVAEHAGHVIPLGSHLTIPRPSPDVPRLDRIGAIYRSAKLAQWPTSIAAHRRPAWWRSFIVLGCWTGLRLSDLRRLDWSAIDQHHITWRASKTKRHGRPVLVIPFVPMVRRHVEILRAMKLETVLGLTCCYKQLRRELQRFAADSGVRYVSPRGLRRFAITQWSKADSMAGRIIHGQGLGVMEHYLPVADYLEAVAPRVQMPVEFLSPKEQLALANNEQWILERYRKATDEDRKLLEDLLRRIS